MKHNSRDYIAYGMLFVLVFLVFASSDIGLWLAGIDVVELEKVQNEMLGGGSEKPSAVLSIAQQKLTSWTRIIDTIVGGLIGYMSGVKIAR